MIANLLNSRVFWPPRPRQMGEFDCCICGCRFREVDAVLTGVLGFPMDAPISAGNWTAFCSRTWSVVCLDCWLLSHDHIYGSWEPRRSGRELLYCAAILESMTSEENGKRPRLTPSELRIYAEFARKDMDRRNQP